MKLSADANQESGKAFETRVATLFSLKGYRITHDTLLSGKQVDLLAEFVAPGNLTLRFLVECKFLSKGKVGNRAVYELAQVYNSLRDKHSLNSAILVSNADFTRYAKEAAAGSGVTLLEYEQLFQDIADFRPYLHRLVNQYESEPIFETYIKLRYCTPRQVRKIENLPAAKRRLKTERFSATIDQYFDDWLCRSTKYQILLLGDYGTGKTTICRHLAYRLAKRYLELGETTRIPLLITLRDYHRAPGARQLITDFLVNRCGVALDFETFNTLNRLGKFVLIQDGFDEMATRVDPGVTLDAVNNLRQFHALRSKVLLTGRPGYFPSQAELESEFQRVRPKDPYEQLAVENIEERQQYRHLYLLTLNRKQVLELLGRRRADLWKDGRMTADQILRKIETTYNLYDLAERPVLLDLIIKTVPRLSVRDQEINTFSLYRIYTDFWLKREESKGRLLIRRKEKLLFVQELAFQMHLESRLVIHYKNLSPVIMKYFHIEEADTLDHFDHDIRTCSFLVRDSEGNYSFVHKSFMEFFVASKLLHELDEGLNWNFGRVLLGQEVASFLNQGIGDSTDILLEWLKGGAPQGGRFTGANALQVLLVGGLDLSGSDLSERALHGVDLGGVNLSKASLRKCDLSGSRLVGVSLRQADLRQANLASSSLRRADLRGADARAAFFVQSDLTDCDLSSCDLGKANLSNIRGWEKVSSFKETKLAGATGLRYEEAEFASVRGAIGKAVLSEEEKRRSVRDKRKQMKQKERTRDRDKKKQMKHEERTRGKK